MKRAIELALEHTPDQPFAAVMVDTESGEIVTEGYDRSTENPLIHGEVDALNHYFASERSVPVERLQLYTTAEPCPMCAGALYWAGIPKVVYGTRISRLKRLDWDQIDVAAGDLMRKAKYPRLQVVGPVMEGECNRLFIEARPTNPR
jgi:tRNA(Arg) A34 adenosine deaminase TadA